MRIILVVAIMIVCFIAITWVALRPGAEVPTLPTLPAIPLDLVPKTSEAQRRAEREAFFQADVDPRIMDADKLNREAAERCISRLQQSLNGYRAGIPPFCDEITGWSTRFGILFRMPGDWWNESNGVNNYIQAKFAKHIFNDKKLAEDIEQALAQYRADVEANQSLMIVSVRAAICTKDIPRLPDIKYTDFSKDVSARLTTFSSHAAKNSLVNGIVIEVASGVGGFAAQQLITQLIVRLSTMVGASTAAAGGATVGGAAVGGGGGAFGGPIGAAAGFAVGIVVGGGIDWWMSKSFEEKMTAQLNGLIDELQKGIIHGDANSPGLKAGVLGSCDLILKAYQDSLRTKIVDGCAK